VTKNIIIDEKLENYISDNSYSLHPIQKEIIEYNKKLGYPLYSIQDISEIFFLQLKV